MKTISHKFVDSFPEQIPDGVLFISIKYATAVHLCCCGCGCETVTPFSPTDWKLIYDGESTSLSPSIGNWSFKCRSHYWIKNGRVQWAEDWTDEQIQLNRNADRVRKQMIRLAKPKKTETTIPAPNPKKGVLSKLIELLFK